MVSFRILVTREGFEVDGPLADRGAVSCIGRDRLERSASIKAAVTNSLTQALRLRMRVVAWASITSNNLFDKLIDTTVHSGNFIAASFSLKISVKWADFDSPNVALDPVAKDRNM